MVSHEVTMKRTVRTIEKVTMLISVNMVRRAEVMLIKTTKTW